MSYLFAVYLKRDMEGPSLDHELSRLANLMAKAPCQWYLVGGIGMDLSHGKWSRPHSDFDIACDLSDAPTLRAYMAQQGYTLAQRITSTNISPSKKIALYKKRDQCILDAQLRFLRTDALYASKDFLSYIDISCMRREQSGTTLGYKGKLFTLSAEYDAPPKRGFLLMNPVYHHALKSISRKSPGRDHDLALLSSLISR